jgi:hypothetical protein
MLYVYRTTDLPSTRFNHQLHHPPDRLPKNLTFSFDKPIAGFSIAQDDAQPAPEPTEAPEEEAPETPQTPETPSVSCSYSGQFLISPEYFNCGVRYLSYVYPSCNSVRVQLLSKKQLKSKPKRAVWLLNAAINGDIEVPTTITSYKRNTCPTRRLQDIEGTNLQLGASSTEWILRPVGDGKDCSLVSLWSVSKEAYLTVSTLCNSFSFADSVGSQQTFKVRTLV